MPKISVIVPVYNVEKYINRCIDSILAQTFTDFELILVDDGSPDNCGKICDEYAEKDSRVRVIHQENGGLSAARNAGIDWALTNSDSEWISFIDSDDWVPQTMLSDLLQAGKKYNADLIKGNFLTVKDEEDLNITERKEDRNEGSIFCFDREQAIASYLCEPYSETKAVNVVVWNALYKKRLFQNIRFPIGKKYEDGYVTPQVVLLSDSIVHINKTIYFYRKNDSGIMASGFNEFSLTALDDWKEAHFRITEQFPKFRKITCTNWIRKYIQVYFQLEQTDNICPAKKAATQKYIISSIKKYLGYFKDNGITNSEILQLKLFILFHKIFSLCNIRVFGVKRNDETLRSAAVRRLKKMHILPYAKKIYLCLHSIKTNIKRAWNKIKMQLYRLTSGITVMDTMETIQYIREHKCSVARFGDGELGMLLGEHNIGFQQYDRHLSEKLAETIRSDLPNLLLCMPEYLFSEKGLEQQAKQFWVAWNHKNLVKVLRYLEQNAVKTCFGDTQITRPYIDRQDRKFARLIFDALKDLWRGRDIMIVEGASTRLGVGNDLFSEATGIKRIIAPAKNAFDFYDEIIEAVERIYQDEFILIALGPTATCLAMELAKKNFWAMDIGHVDIEYEWYLSGSEKKCAVLGKYVNEANGGNAVPDCVDQAYLNSIICKIGSDSE